MTIGIKLFYILKNKWYSRNGYIYIYTHEESIPSTILEKKT